jgi:hypothetical protein
VASVVLGNPTGVVPTRVTGSASFGTNSVLTLARGEIGMAVISPSAGAPGAGAVKFAAVCGTTVGTAKIIVYAGTSATPVTPWITSALACPGVDTGLSNCHGTRGYRPVILSGQHGRTGSRCSRTER